MRLRSILSALALLALAAGTGSCGYSFRSDTNPWAKKGVTRIYIPMLLNDSLKPGVEVPVTSSLLKEFSRSRRIKVVSDEKDADAVVQGRVVSFASTINSQGTVSQLSQDPNAQALSDMVIAVEYVVTLTIDVSLVKKKDHAVLWSQQFSRPKIYPAGNRFGLQGDTSVLINASEEQLALEDIATFVAGDVYDTMMEAF